MKILMVCLGNICRSPLAEGILKSKINELGIGATVHSAGTSNYHAGDSADPRTIDVAQKHGINLHSHTGRQFTVNDFDKYDKIFTMDSSNHRNVLRLARNESDRRKVEMILNISHPGSNMDVPDPYFGGQNGFENVYRMLDDACEAIIKNMNFNT
jgi:protein-tyrosine phosphatase